MRAIPPVARAIIAFAFGLVLVAAPVATWWSISPYATIEGLAKASYDGDEISFRSYLDIPALRTNALRREVDDIHRKGAAAHGVHLNDRAIASSLMGPFINRAFSARTAYDMVHRKDHVDGRDVSYVLMRDGPNWFEIRFLAPSPLVLKFRRNWFSWRLVDVWVDGSEKTQYV